MKKILIINGVARSGKDTFVDMLSDLDGVSVIFRASTIDRVKEIAVRMGCDVVRKSDADRSLLSDIKLAWTAFNDGIFKDLTKRIRSEFMDATDSEVNIATVMCREPEEIDKFIRYYGSHGCKSVLIDRPGLRVPGNMSDEGVMGYGYDYIILNDGGLDKLVSSARELIEALKLEDRP